MDNKKPLNVLQLIPSLQEGGTEQGTVDMALYIQQQGGVSVVASSGGTWVKVLKGAGVHHINLPLHRKNPIALVWNMARIAQLIRHYDIHIVHARSRFPAWCAWLILPYMENKCVKFITTFHGTYGTSSALKRWYNRVMLKGEWVIANSGFIAKHVVETYGYNPARIHVAERGVDVKVFDPKLYSASARQKLRQQLGVSDDVPLLLMVGRLTRWKGHALLLKALYQLTNQPWVLAVAGGAKHPAYQTELEALAKKLGLAERIRWLGPRGDVALLNATADVALSCSTQPEAFGRVAIEAMAMETPIIATALGGSLDTVVHGQTGWLVEPTPDAVAQALREALANLPHTKAMGKAGRKRVLERFTSQHTCAAEWAAYEALMGAPA